MRNKQKRWAGVLGGWILGVVLLPTGEVCAGAQGDSVGRDTAAGKPVAVSFLNGITVELLGLCASPARGLQWWAPDGSPLPKAPFAGWEAAFGRQWARQGGNEPNCYEVALRVTGGGSEPVSVEWQFTRGSQAWSGPARHGEQDLHSMFIEDYTRAAPMDFRVAAATGPWKTDCVYAPATQHSDFAMTELGEHAVIWQSPTKPPEKRPGKLKLAVIHDYKGDYEVRVVAMDEQGAVHETVGAECNFANRLTVLRNYFDLEVQQVREFQLQVRPLYWAYFQNVSLRPGGRTNPTTARKPPENKP